MKRRGFILKIICFAIAVSLAFHVVSRVLNPKYLQDNNWPTTQTFTDFYQLERDSIDVLFFGSSHCVSAFSPVQLYKTHGIRSYNLGSEQQNLLISYYWLKEALRFQSPKVVILDTYLLFTYKSGEALNSSEATQRKAIDYMKWSSIKREAIADICKNDKKQTASSYYLPTIRFHTRWTRLNEDDFTYGLFPLQQGLMGYSALNRCGGSAKYAPFHDDDSAKDLQPVELMAEYLNKIVQLCEEKGINLILVKTPSTAGNVRKYKYLTQYASAHGVRYIDFNEESVYAKMEYDFQHDNNDNGHLNIWGAEKVTGYIGDVLVGQYGMPAIKSEAHEKLLANYDGVKKDCELRTITDFSEYLDQINDLRYAVFISVKDEGTSALDDSLKKKLSSLGTTVNFDKKYRYSYYAVINGDDFKEEIKAQRLSSKGTLRNGKVFYTITSAGFSCGNKSSIIIDGREYSPNQRGMNFAVYNLERRKVIDSVCFDTFKGLKATRK